MQNFRCSISNKYTISHLQRFWIKTKINCWYQRTYLHTTVTISNRIYSAITLAIKVLNVNDMDYEKKTVINVKLYDVVAAGVSVGAAVASTETIQTFSSL